MNAFQLVMEGFALGLSLGVSCLATCAPIYLPYILAEKRKTGSALLVTLEISAGRFFSYLAFGAIVGMLGGQIETVNRELFTSIANLLIAAFLVFTALRTNRQHRHCPVPKLSRFTNSGFLLGIVTGINFCPGFLGALSRAMAAGGAFAGMLLFLGFFVGTTLFVLPMGFAGALTKVKKLVLIGQVASLLVALWFIFTGVKGLVDVYRMTHIDENARLVEVLSPNHRLVVVTSDSTAFISLRDSLATATGHQVPIMSELPQLGPGIMVFLDSRSEDRLANRLDRTDYIAVEPGYPVDEVMNFLRIHSFRSDKPLRWAFRK
jgi:sulfite exporter TauE/SafE